MESQRFINAGDANIVLPPAVLYSDEETQDRFIWSAIESIKGYEDTQIAFRKLPKKQRNEAARGLLPNCVETRMVVTGNLRAWHEVIQRRTQPDADAEIQQVMRLAAQQLRPIAPTIFPDK